MQSTVRMVGSSVFWSIMIFAPMGCGQQHEGGKDDRVMISDSMEEKALQEVGSLYQVYLDESKRSPRRLADLEKYGAGLPFGYDWLNRGDLVVFWGVNLSDAATDTVLAYEKKVPEAGGFVLMQDGKTVKQMSAEEFKGAPKAKNNETK